MRIGSLVLLGVVAVGAHVVTSRHRAAADRVEDDGDTAAASPSGPLAMVRPRARRAIATTVGALRSSARAARVLLVTLGAAPLVAYAHQRAVLAEGGSACSLATAYGLLATAIAALAAAAAAAAIFFNIPGLIFAIGATVTVSFVLIPQIRAAIEAYDRCMGPTDRCRLDYRVNELGRAAMFVSIGAWTVALVVQILAAVHLASFFLAWLGGIELLAGEALKYGGIVANSAAAIALVGFTTNLVSWQRCHEAQKRPSPIPVGVG